jgi:NitT/TauT family transport system substrate-binding protein
MSAQVYGSLPVILAQQLGYYDQEGLAVQIEHVQSNSKAVHALAGGSADVSTGNFGQVLSLAAEGRVVRAFATLLLGAQQVLVVNPEKAPKLRTVADLRGTTVGLGGLGGPSHQLLNWLLDRNGVPASSVSLVSVGTLATAIAAMEHGKADAAVLNEVEYLMLKKRGFDPVVMLDARGPENARRIFGFETYPTAVLISTGPWLREHADVARRLARAVNRTVRWMKQQSPAAIVQKIPEQYRGATDIDVATVSTILPMISVDGRMSEEGAAAVHRVVSVSLEAVRMGRFDLRQTYTNDFVSAP